MRKRSCGRSKMTVGEDNFRRARPYFYTVRPGNAFQSWCRDTAKSQGQSDISVAGSWEHGCSSPPRSEREKRLKKTAEPRRS
jgi:hypothetical protein